MTTITDINKLEKDVLYMFHPVWTDADADADADEIEFFDDDEVREKVKSILQCKGYVYKEKEEKREIRVDPTESVSEYSVYWFAEQDLVKKKETIYIPVIFQNGKG